MALAVSVRDLYERCIVTAKAKNIKGEHISSYSWFKSQFWPKNSYTNAALNYTGRFKVRYMVQQRNVRKYTPDGHYCAVLYKYSRQLAMMFKVYTAFTSTDDKCKIKIGEPNFLVAAVTRGKQVLVPHGTFLQAADHDHASSTLTPIVFLSHEIPNNIDNSWYRGVSYV